MPDPAVSYLPTAGILIETSLGSLVFDLYGCDCPGLTANFVNLCRCHFWNGAVATEVIPGAAFFSHAADPVYDALLGEAAAPSEGVLQGNFWELLRRCNEIRWRNEAERHLRTPLWNAAKEAALAKTRFCEGIANVNQAGGPKMIFRATRGALQGPQPAGSLCRRGLLILRVTPTASATASSSAVGAAASVGVSESFRFGITLSDQHLDFLEGEYVAIGQVAEGAKVLDAIRRAPRRDCVEAATSTWPKLLRMLRVKHTTVLPTPGGDRLLARVLPNERLARVLRGVGCFAFWAPAEAVAAASRVVVQQAAAAAVRYQYIPATTPEAAVAALPDRDSPAQPLVLAPHPEKADENGKEKAEGILSPVYNAHYTGDYLSSDEDGPTGDFAHGVGHSSLMEQRQRRQAVLEMHREHANTTLALMLNLLNGVADVKGELKPPENVLFVCKLNPVTTSEGLAMCFAQFGRVVSAEVVMDKATKRSLCYGFVEFDTVDACYRAFQKMDRALIDDSRIHVDFSQSVSKLWFQKQREMRKRARGA